VANTGTAAFKTILTHGFVMDEHSRKMSKSEGNVVDPSDVINGTSSAGGGRKQNALGADTLRLWVSSVDYTKDVCLGSSVLSKVEDSMKKLRITVRFLLGCLGDFAPEHAVPYHELQKVDRYLLHQLNAFAESLTFSYRSYDFARVC
jgi:isoleucyl-tRNA synthetase